jgi:hypothetical protein
LTYLCLLHEFARTSVKLISDFAESSRAFPATTIDNKSGIAALESSPVRAGTRTSGPRNEGKVKDFFEPPPALFHRSPSALCWALFLRAYVESLRRRALFKHLSLADFDAWASERTYISLSTGISLNFLGFELAEKFRRNCPGHRARAILHAQSRNRECNCVVVVPFCHLVICIFRPFLDGRLRANVFSQISIKVNQNSIAGFAAYGAPPLPSPPPLPPRSLIDR